MQGHKQDDDNNGDDKDVKLDLHALNHAIALLEPDEYEAEMQRLKVQLTDKHSHIHDIFSDEQLDTRTQLTLLKFREAGRHKEPPKGLRWTGHGEYQQARKDSQFRASKSQRDGVGPRRNRRAWTRSRSSKRSAAGDREKAFWPDSGILMLGAAIGKSTQLKRLVLCAPRWGWCRC